MESKNLKILLKKVGRKSGKLKFEVIMISSKNEEKIRKKPTYYICISSNSNRVSVLFPKNNWKNDDFIKNETSHQIGAS